MKTYTCNCGRPNALQLNINWDLPSDDRLPLVERVLGLMVENRYERGRYAPLGRLGHIVRRDDGVLLDFSTPFAAAPLASMSGSVSESAGRALPVRTVDQNELARGVTEPVPAFPTPVRDARPPPQGFTEKRLPFTTSPGSLLGL